jgi:hypothetical protein
MRRRRKNPISIGWLPWIVVAGAIYWLWKNKPNIFPPGSLLDSATTSIANLFPGTSPSVQVSNSLLVGMPDGTFFPASDLSKFNFKTVNGQAQFVFNDGVTYALTPQVNGVYSAIAL